jgi:hypothetical protein
VIVAFAGIQTYNGRELGALCTAPRPLCAPRAVDLAAAVLCLSKRELQLCERLLITI